MKIIGGDCLPNVSADTEWVLDGEGVATTKVDGSCCAITAVNAIKCQDKAGPITWNRYSHQAWNRYY